MNTLSFKVPPEVEQKVAVMAEEAGTTVDFLLNDMTRRMIDDFEAYRLFQGMAEKGRNEVDEALTLLQKS